ncbi:MAG: efflux RND transporter periplasmic adaptor subunit [Planctomycetes bacterium]|nr:efflux RND transporter periplasmic adaptor subunit [Planctomycetota bacterium]
MRKRKRRLWKWLLLLVIVAGGIVFLAMRPAPAPEVFTAQAERVEVLKAVVTASGEIEAHESVDIQTEIAGVIVELPVTEGERVEKGQLLLRIDPLQTETEVQSARAQHAAAEAEVKGVDARTAAGEANIAKDKALVEAARVDLAQAEVSAKRSRSAFDRTRKLFEKGLVPVEEDEIAEAEAKLADARVDAANARIAQLQAQQRASEIALEELSASREAATQRAAAAKALLDRMEDLLEKTKIESPLDGVITHLNVEVGERAVPGILSNPQATLMTIADLSVIEARIDVDETDIVRVALEMSAEVIVDAMEDTPFSGKVTEIANAPTMAGTSSQQGKDFEVVVRLASPTASLPMLRPGMSCEAKIQTSERKDVLVIPIQALVMREVFIGKTGEYEGVVPPPRPGEEVRVAEGDGKAEKRKREERQGIFVVGPEGKARFRPVRTGILGEMDVEVLEGAAEGDTVIIGPMRSLRTIGDGDAVQARPALGRGARDEADDGV